MSERQSRAAILCVGDELTEGRTLDRHGKFLSELLTELGATVDRISLVPDELDAYRREFLDLFPRVGTLIITGGLGPTSDDLTREAVAEAAQVELEFHEDIWEWLQNRFPHRRISETNRKQALIPAGFDVIPNEAGTAPGFVGSVDGCSVVALPGPPRELQTMVDRHLRSILGARFGVREAEVFWATTFMIPESELEEALQRHGEPSVWWGTNTEGHRILLRLRGGDAPAREAFFTRLREELGAERVVEGRAEIGEVVLNDLRRAGRRLVCAESCTGGLVAKLVTDIPGSSAGLWGGFVTYSNTAKTAVLGVLETTLAENGAVSPETAGEMALGALERSDGEAGIAVAITGVAGPGGGTEEKPVGTVWIAVAADGGIVKTRHVFLPRDRDRVRRWSAVSALLLVREALSELA
ncbi:MAG: nicotinamide-nucleotide amidohydrolase family protein [Spirochaetes bacterium]|nr:nicotinamide-nucleotide amidohydrolase family protein [Spirochaetota bacterium]